MGLKKRDGTPFRLAGPVPYMRDQQMWEAFTLHNFTFKGVTVDDNGPEEVVRQGKLGFVEELADLTKQDAKAVEVIEPTPVEELPEQIPTKKMPSGTAATLNNAPNKVTVRCLPGVIQKNKDDLYGETRSQIVYGDPFMFEGVVVYGDDLAMTVWSPTDQVTKGSVIFPQNRDKRWWRVASVESKMEGWMLHCGVSDFQPQYRV